MNQIDQAYRFPERGFGTVTISVIILTLLTLVTLYTAKTTLTEQQISGDQYRSDQALGSASAAMDYAIAYYNSKGGADHDDDGNLDYTSIAPAYISIVDPSGELTVTSGAYYFNPTPEVMVVNATGYSDDQSAIHNISVKVANTGVVGTGNKGPDYPLISRNTTGLSGNVSLINRFTHKTAWTGEGEINWGSGAGHVANPNYTGSWTHAKRVDLSTNNSYTMEASNKDSGQNSDVISNDPNLKNLVGDAFFRNFFVEDKTTTARFAEEIGQRYPASLGWSGIVNKAPEGLVWVDGDLTLSGNEGTIGSQNDPVEMVIDGNFTNTGAGPPGIDLYGTLYITGKWDTQGNMKIQGSVIVEGALGVTGNGSPTIVFDPTLFESGNGLDPPGIKGVVAGTWRDWTN